MNPTHNATVSKESSIGNGNSHPVKNTSMSLLRSDMPVLNEEMLARFASRAASYDRENRFFDEDFGELRTAKYLLLPLPSEFGGAGMTLAEVCRQQRRLAYYAPATALAVNMHLYWVGVAAVGEMSHWNGSCARRRPARSSQPAMRKAAMICRSCSRPRKRNASTAATGSRAGSTLAA